MIQSDFGAKIRKPDEKLDTGLAFVSYGLLCSHAGLPNQANPRLDEFLLKI
jgi:hypothetical protein